MVAAPGPPGPCGPGRTIEGAGGPRRLVAHGPLSPHGPYPLTVLIPSRSFVPSGHHGGGIGTATPPAAPGHLQGLRKGLSGKSEGSAGPGLGEGRAGNALWGALGIRRHPPGFMALVSN